MSELKYVGKCLLIENDAERVLVVGDLHVGYGASGEVAGAIVNSKIYGSMIEDFNLLFDKIGNVDKMVLLGDLKHSFSSLREEERYGLVNLFDYLSGKSEELIVIKGNHDNYLVNLTGKRKIKVVEYYLLGEYCFLHGDRNFDEIHEKKIKCWIMGHLHPAIKLREGSKMEKYKCFLSGNFMGKEIVILPSFVESGGGADVCELDNALVWDFDLSTFSVLVVGERLEVLDFGKLKNIN